MDISEILLSNGYESFRYSKNNTWELNSNVTDFSSLSGGGNCVMFKKGIKSVVYGMHEKDKPPVIISPRGVFMSDDDVHRRVKKLGLKGYLKAFDIL